MADTIKNKPSTLVKARKDRFFGCIDGMIDFFNWMAEFVWRFKGVQGIKIDSRTDPNATRICIDPITADDVITGPAGRYVDGELYDVCFVYKGDFYNLGDKVVGSGTHYLHINKSNPQSSRVNQSAQKSGNEIVVPLCQIGSFGTIQHSYQGCPVIDDGVTPTTYWYEDQNGNLNGCVVFLGASRQTLSAPSVPIPENGSLYANISFAGLTPTLTISSSSVGDVSFLVASSSNGQTRTLGSPIILPVYI